MTRYVELGDRVFSVEVVPDPASRPERCLRTLTIRVESGEPLTDEEYERVSAAVVAELIAAGNDVRSWGCDGEVP